jgi:protein-S-isoprenylcysteine O-methyltransferase Ste14
MFQKIASIAALALALCGVYYMLENQYILSTNPITISIQVLAAGLMIWARITFGVRSFHAAANPTEGKLVTNGPYRWFRHPIYASLIYFFWACVIAFPCRESLAAVSVITAGLFIRMLLEEQFLMLRYPEYGEYCKRTGRIIPVLF